MAKQTLTQKTEDLSKWYTQVIQQAELADYSPVKGCMVFRPGSYEIWEAIQQILDPQFKSKGVRNAYFPIFIPMSLLEREADHVEGFAPELAVVTHGGGEKLEENLAVRPTSETIMYETFGKWIESHRDLPLLLNQWNNVVRWEKRTYFFMRTTEFLWNEGHTAHASHQEAWDLVLEILEIYSDLLENYLAIPVYKGRKSKTETFAGADLTTTIEALMPDGKALQAGTSHDLGQHFSQKSAFNISFQNEQGETDYVWQTSWAVSTRLLGALILTHGDNDGLVLPPKVAPRQVILVTAQSTDEQREAARKLATQLTEKGIRVEINDQDRGLGWKLNDAELKGYPVIAVIGNRELENQEISLKLRHSGEKMSVKISKVAETMPAVLESIQAEMLKKATQKRAELTSEVSTYDEFKQVMANQRGFIKAYWCEQAECEKTIKEETKATTRCLPFVDNEGTVVEEKGSCIKCGQAATHRWLFAQSY